jgi:hypothetical protein
VILAEFLVWVPNRYPTQRFLVGKTVLIMFGELLLQVSFV